MRGASDGFGVPKGQGGKSTMRNAFKKGVGGTRDMARAKPDYDGDLVIGFLVRTQQIREQGSRLVIFFRLAPL